MFKKGDFRVGDKIRVTVPSLYKEGTIAYWDDHYGSWAVVITSRFCRGEILCVDSSMMELRKGK